jgi:hypothetical protein
LARVDKALSRRWNRDLVRQVLYCYMDRTPGDECPDACRHKPRSCDTLRACQPKSDLVVPAIVTLLWELEWAEEENICLHNMLWLAARDVNLLRGGRGTGDHNSREDMKKYLDALRLEVETASREETLPG